MFIRSFLMHIVLVALVAAGCSDSDTKPDAGDAKAGEGTVGDTGSGDTSTTPYTPLIAEAELKRIVSALADDNMDGRDEGTPGGDKARAYVIDELKKCNVTPAGDGGTFEQKITAGKGTNVIGKIEGSGSAADGASSTAATTCSARFGEQARAVRRCLRSAARPREEQGRQGDTPAPHVRASTSAISSVRRRSSDSSRSRAAASVSARATAASRSGRNTSRSWAA